MQSNLIVLARRTGRAGLALALLAMVAVAPETEALAPVGSSVAMVSVNATGTAGGNGNSTSAFINGDGNRVAFSTTANDLGPADAGSDGDVYVRDLTTGVTTLVSGRQSGGDGGNGTSDVLGISADGNRVLFQSDASDLVANDDPDPTFPGRDIYVRDLATSTTILVSVNRFGTDGGDRGSFLALMSDDGNRVAFLSLASDLVPNDDDDGETADSADVYVRDLATSTTYLASVNLTADDGGNHGADDVVISADGTRVAFTSASNNLTTLDDPNNINRDVYVYDITSGDTLLASVNAAGTQSVGNAFLIDLDADGTTVAFRSNLNTFGPPDAGFDEDVYVRDLAAGVTRLASVSAAGGDGANGLTGLQSRGNGLSADGTKAFFSSEATNLDPDTADTNGVEDIYMRDLVAGTTDLVSVDGTGADSANGASYLAGISADGSRVLFLSDANNLGPPDLGSTFAHFDSDLYLRDLTTATTVLVNRNAAGTDASSELGFNPVFGVLSADGARVAFQARGSDLGPPDPVEFSADIFVSPGTDADDGVVVDAPADGTVSTGTDPSPEDPVETAVFTPNAGPVVIEEREETTTEAPGGYALLGQEVEITAPAASAEDPLTLTFRIDESALPEGVDETNVAVLREGVVVPPCTGPPGDAVPSPCVSSRARVGTDVVLTVLTIEASTWNFAGALPSSAGDFLFALAGSQTVGDDLKVQDEDVVRYLAATDSFELVLDGSDVGLSRLAIDALSLLPGGDFVLSFKDPGRVPDVGKVDDSDVVRFHPSTLGPDTSGTFSLYFDASVIGLTTGGEDVDALEIVGADVYMSTTGSFDALGTVGSAEDVFVCRPASGCDESQLAFDGSGADLTGAGEDIDGLAFENDDATSTPLFSTAGAFSAGGISGRGEDIFSCDRALSDCQNAPSLPVSFDLVFDGDLRTIARNITAIEFGLGSL